VPADDTSIRRALYGKMAGDTTLNNLLATPPQGSSKSIYYAVAPQGASFPYVLFDKSSGVPTYTMQTGTSAMENTIWLIKAVDQSTSADRAESIDARLTVLLTDATLSISGGTLMYLRRESDVDYPEVTDGVNYRHVGSLWRLIHQ
jgi:hypothetical protein